MPETYARTGGLLLNQQVGASLRRAGLSGEALMIIAYNPDAADTSAFILETALCGTDSGAYSVRPVFELDEYALSFLEKTVQAELYAGKNSQEKATSAVVDAVGCFTRQYLNGLELCFAWELPAKEPWSVHRLGLQPNVFRRLRQHGYLQGLCIADLLEIRLEELESICHIGPAALLSIRECLTKAGFPPKWQ